MRTKTRPRRRRGQATTEYIVIVGLIAVGLIPFVSRLSGVLGNTVAKATGAIDNHVTRKIGAMGGGGGGSSGGGGSGSLDNGATAETNTPVPHASP
jgi:Flp pilus assembly pilin Flp